MVSDDHDISMELFKIKFIVFSPGEACLGTAVCYPKRVPALRHGLASHFYVIYFAASLSYLSNVIKYVALLKGMSNLWRALFVRHNDCIKCGHVPTTSITYL